MNLAQLKQFDPYKLPGAHKCDGDVFYGFMKIHLANRETAEDVLLHSEFTGDWYYYSNTILGKEYTKNIKRLGIKKGDPVERHFTITIYLFDADNPKNKAVETFEHDAPLDAEEMGSFLYQLATGMAAQYPDIVIDYEKSYAVVRA